LLDETNAPECILIDVTECPIERPVKHQKQYYSGKKKIHTLKIQLVLDLTTGQILCVDQADGHVHDFTLYKETIGSRLLKDILIRADSGYQGIHDFHRSSEIPYKKSKNQPLSDEQKAFNRALSRKRIAIEHTNRTLKVFKVMKYPYRNRRKRHLLRMTLLCGIHNAELFAKA
jgi:hypothetical protein